MGQYVAAMLTVTIDSLILLQQFDAATDPLTHEWSTPTVSGDARGGLGCRAIARWGG